MFMLCAVFFCGVLCGVYCFGLAGLGQFLVEAIMWGKLFLLGFSLHCLSFFFFRERERKVG